MPVVVGRDEAAVKRVTCDGCASVLEYTAPEVQTRRYTAMGDPSGYEYVVCPSCGEDAKIPGTSW